MTFEESSPSRMEEKEKKEDSILQSYLHPAQVIFICFYNLPYFSPKLEGIHPVS